MKLPLRSLAALLALACLSLRAAPSPDDEKLVAAVRAADDERVAATCAADRARLTAVMSDDLRYAHSSGVIDTKASYIEPRVTGVSKQDSITYEERTFTVASPTVVLMTGKGHFISTSKGQTGDLHLGFLGVWRLENGRWRFLAWQSLKLPEPAPAAK